MSDSNRTSLFKVSGLPEAFGVIILTLALVVVLSPYLPGENIGNLNFLTFGPTVARIVKTFGPILFVILILAFVPVLPKHWFEPASPVTEDSKGNDSGNTLSIGEIASTCISGNNIHLVIAKNGVIVGGADALRRVALALLDFEWEGKFHIRHEYYEDTLSALSALIDRAQLSVEEAKQSANLQALERHLATSIRTLELGLQLSFHPQKQRDRFWGIPVSSERVTSFIENLLVPLALAPAPSGSSVRCQLYVPGYPHNPVWADMRFSEEEASLYTEGWVQELNRHKQLPWAMLDWDQLIPVWKFDDDFIAARLLPPIVAALTQMVSAEQFNGPEMYLTKLSTMFPESQRNPLNPYHWVVAVRSERHIKDLSWLVSPPPARSELLKDV